MCGMQITPGTNTYKTHNVCKTRNGYHYMHFLCVQKMQDVFLYIHDALIFKLGLGPHWCAYFHAALVQKNGGTGVAFEHVHLRFGVVPM
jgi:hypothetical protein